MRKLIVLMLMFAALMVQAIPPPVETSQRDNVITTAQSYLHVREVTPNSSPEINRFLASTGLGSGYAWCAAFVNYVYVANGIETPAKASAWSPSWFPPDKVIYMRGYTSDRYVNQADAFGIYYKNRQRVAHVGLIYKWPTDKQYCYTIEGNTNDNGSREGDGVYKKRRLKRQIYQVSNWIDSNSKAVISRQSRLIKPYPASIPQNTVFGIKYSKFNMLC